MSQQNKKVQEKFQQLKALMLDGWTQKQKDEHPLGTKLLETVILIHAVNIQNGLCPIDQNEEKIQFQQKWTEDKEGVYKFRYQIMDKSNKKQNVLFRFIEQNDSLNVNFCLQGEGQLQSYTVEKKQDHEEIVKKHLQKLNKFLPKNPKIQRQQQPFLRPVDIEPTRPQQRGPNHPMPLTRPDNLPFNNPFGSQEYVGPHSSIFGNRNSNPGFEGPDPRGRYDPVDPFDTDHHPRQGPDNDFQGFDQFGRPINRPKLPKGPNFPSVNNPFDKHPPGFGGGFGGGFGSNSFF